MSDPMCSVQAIATMGRRSDMHKSNMMMNRRGAARRQMRAGQALRARVVELSVFAVLLCALAFAGYRATAPAAAQYTQTESIKVSSHETLWQIAAEHRIGGLSTAETVELIKQINGMTDSGLHVGQVVEVPVAASAMSAMASR